jgi:hypothetical protein
VFWRWLDPEGHYGRAALSPIAQDYKGLAPIYLQAGGREVLRDMIRDFATTQAEQGADVLLDIWPDMPHDFQAFDTEKQSSTEALSRIRSAVTYHVDREGSFAQRAEHRSGSSDISEALTGDERKASWLAASCQSMAAMGAGRS